MDCSTPGFPVHHQLPELVQTHVHRIGDAMQPSHPLSSPSPPALNLSQHQGLFQRVNSSHKMAKYWSFSFSISPSNEYSGLISFRMDWMDLHSGNIEADWAYLTEAGRKDTFEDPGNISYLDLCDMNMVVC